MNEQGATRPIAVVDDSADDVEILTRCFLRSELPDAYEIRPFHTGSDFLDHMRLVESGVEPIPTVVLLDINMPEMNGFEILRWLRSVPAFEIEPAVVFMSNTDWVEDKERALALGARVVPKFGTIHEGVDFFDNLAG
ncbi:MAG: response regulator [Acidimicrobiia bacterium]|nr:response regulator [Acidimicrobiia bacterium]